MCWGRGKQINHEGCYRDVKTGRADERCPRRSPARPGGQRIGNSSTRGRQSKAAHRFTESTDDPVLPPETIVDKTPNTELLP